ncbi:MAG: hypothetical protein V1898_02145 [Patescibacteria group bacterium]
MKKIISIFSTVSLALLLWAPAMAKAADIMPSCVLEKKVCTVCDVLDMVSAIVQMMIASLSGVVLLMFIIGGFFMITSAGNADRVTKGKKIMGSALVGVLIIALSWVGVNTVIGILVGKNLTEINGTTGEKNSIALFPNDKDTGNKTAWWQFPSCVSKQATDTANCQDSFVGDACVCSSPVSGDKNCYCNMQVALAGGVAKALELNQLGASCMIGTKNICACQSICDRMASYYVSWKDYTCVAINSIKDKECKTGGNGYCPYSSKSNKATHMCCK